MAVSRCPPESGFRSNGRTNNQESDSKFKKLLLLFFNVVDLTLFLLDIALDIWVAVKFYKKEDYVSLGVLVFLLIGSAILTHIYSWLWYKYDNFTMMTNLERILDPGLGVLHILLKGVYIRYAAVVTTSMENIRFKSPKLKSIITYRKHDLRILKIFESFSESAPQIVLMLTIALRGEGWILNILTVIKTLVSLLSLALSEVKYYRSLISSFPEDIDHGGCGCCGHRCWKAKRLVGYFFWNLILLSCRLVALALFASVEPCFIFTHFICSWLVLFFLATYLDTNFMKCKGGRWLFQGTLGLIWYFSWFSGVVRGKTFKRMLCYHIYMLVDICFLCGMWYWKMSLDPPHIEISCLKVVIAAVSVPALYVCGLVLKWYYFFENHPRQEENDQKEGNMEEEQEPSLTNPTEPSGEVWICVKKQKQHCLQIFKNLVFYVFYLFHCLIQSPSLNKIPGLNRLPCVKDYRDELEFEAIDFSHHESSCSNKRMEELANSFYS